MRSSSDVENPIFQTKTKELMPFELYKPGAFATVPLCGNNYCTLTEYLAKEGITLGVTNWDESLVNAQKIIETSINTVNIQRAKTVSVDAYSILVNAKRELKGETNAYNGLVKIRNNADRIIDGSVITTRVGTCSQRTRIRS